MFGWRPPFGPTLQIRARPPRALLTRVGPATNLGPSMTALLRHLLLALMTLCLCPGLAEALHDGVHQLVEAGQPHGDQGDWAAADDDCPEHGCTPLAHHCHCCVSMVAMQTSQVGQPAWHALARLQTWTAHADTRRADGVAVELQRPPRA